MGRARWLVSGGSWLVGGAIEEVPTGEHDTELLFGKSRKRESIIKITQSYVMDLMYIYMYSYTCNVLNYTCTCTREAHSLV